MKLNLLIFLAIIVVTAANNYDGYKLYKVNIKTENDLKVVKEVQSEHIGEFWEDEFDVNNAVKVMVAPEKQREFLEFLTADGVDFTEVVGDLKRAIDDQMRPASFRTATSFHSLNWNQYHNLEEIYDWLDELAAAYPDIVTVVSMGSSFEQRDTKGVVIKYHANTTQIGMLEGTLHAREWISAATTTWIIKEFLTSTDKAVRELAESFEWHIFPVVNPDGYAYTFSTNRMWRKNRSTLNSVTCSPGVNDDMSNGVDLNRNFDFEWNTVGVSQDPCDNTYAGPSAASEPETSNIFKYVEALHTIGQLMYYIAFHSYTQLIIVPYSHLESGSDAGSPDNYADLYEIAQNGRQAILDSSGTVYRVGISADVMYPMSGTSFDWVKNNTNVPICYLIELRDLGEYGFLLIPELIIPTASETVVGLLEMDKTARAMGYYEVVEINAASNSVISMMSVVFGAMVYALIN